MTAEEQAWLRSTWDAPAVAAMRQQAIANGRAWANATTPAERIRLREDTDALVQAFKPQEMPLLSAGGPSWIEAGRKTGKRTAGNVIRTSAETWGR